MYNYETTQTTDEKLLKLECLKLAESYAHNYGEQIKIAQDFFDFCMETGPCAFNKYKDSNLKPEET